MGHTLGQIPERQTVFVNVNLKRRQESKKNGKLVRNFKYTILTFKIFTNVPSAYTPTLVFVVFTCDLEYFLTYQGQEKYICAKCENELFVSFVRSP